MAEETRNPVEILAEEYLTLLRQGKEPHLEDFAAGHPAHADALREVLPTMLTLERAKRDKESTGSGRARLGVPKLERLGDFRIVREVGRGGMGIVFEAVQESLGRRVALKVLPRQSLLTGHQLQRFEREAQTAARLHHTNIVPVYGTGEHDGFHFYAMQFIDGRGLDKVIAELESHRQATPAAFGAAPVPDTVRAPSTRGQDYWRQVARIGMQVANALHYAHGQGTLHRDVKPSNLLLDEHGTVWITDFGLAKALEQQGLTHSGDLLGTLQYMPPEQFRGQYDIRSEVYALGLTLYELLTRRPAFTGRNRSEILDRIQNSEPLAPRKVDPEVPADLETIVLKAIAKDPAHRYADAGELGEDLERYLEDRPILARRASAAEQLWRWCRRNKAMASLVAATLIAVLGAGIVGWTAFVLEREATERAEGNLNLAIAAFEDVFDALAGPDPFQALEEDPETGEYQPVLRSAVNEQNAQVLLGLLDFYDRFAQQNAGNRELLEDTAAAYRRVGDIQQQLRQLDEADAAYRKALVLYSGLGDHDVRAEIAALHNELGQVQLRQGKTEEAAASYRTALRILTGRPPATTRRHRFELARTHYLLASTLDWVGRRGERRGADRDPPEVSMDREKVAAHHREALDTVAGLLADDPDNPELLSLQSRCKIAHARHLRRRPGGRGRDEQPSVEDLAASRAAMEQAIANLETLVERFPEADSYRYELVEVYLESLPFRGLESSSMEAGEILSRLRTASRHAEKLVEQRADSHEYRMQLFLAASRFGHHVSRSLGREGELASGDDALCEEAEQALRRALGVIEHLEDGTRRERRMINAWSMIDRVELGNLLGLQGRLDEARTELEEVIRQAEPEDPERADRWRRAFLDRPLRLLAWVLERQGNVEEAARVREKADLHGQPDHRDGRRRGPGRRDR